MTAVTVAWVTAAGAGRKRHLAYPDGPVWRAVCGAVLDQLDPRHVIPSRCGECLSAASQIPRGHIVPRAEITGSRD